MKRIIAILLAAVLCLGLCACAGTEVSGKLDEIDAALAGVQGSLDVYAAQQEAKAEAAAAAARAAELKTLETNVMVLNGTTGFGMAKLMADAEAGDAALDYSFTVESDASAITAALINGSCDIAALPTNAAATLYNKTEGGVQIAAINTLGVLYLVGNMNYVSLDMLSDLDGHSVYVPAQNPSFIFSALCKAAGVDAEIDNSYAEPASLRTAAAAGETDVAILPEPMVTIACAANDDLEVMLDLTEIWDEYYPAGSLVQGCVVVRREFAEQNPDAVTAFLAEYESSIAYLTDKPADAAQLIEAAGVFPQAAVAQKAIPHCNVCFIAGEDMKKAMNSFCEIMFEVEPASVGGAIPGDDFYFLG